jgi:hypothetical protein
MPVKPMTDVQNTRKRRAKSIQKQPSAATKALRARPVKGKIDYAELSREHIKRYPKILAALAK